MDTLQLGENNPAENLEATARLESKTQALLQRQTVRQFLRAPLFIKILVANALIVGAGAFVGTWLTETVSGVRNFELGLALAFTLAGVVLSAVVNYIVLKTAFRPLITLQRAASTVRAGNLSARAEPSTLSDPQMEQLSDTFNTMLDTLEERNMQLRRVAAQVIGAQEEERKRIARELHDQTAQTLTTLLVRLKLLEKADSAEKLRDGLAEMRSLLAGTMDDVRELSRSLRPTLLDDLGLVPALEAYLNQLKERTTQRINFVVRGFERANRLPGLLELVCYRVVQEGVTNAMRYASAQQIDVVLERTSDLVRVSIKDDGNGFDLESERATNGLGILGMRERAELAGGTFSLKSKSGLGTLICLEIPLAGIAFSPFMQANSKTKNQGVVSER
jgi:two-component system sensor histidine kinase UhpB